MNNIFEHPWLLLGLVPLVFVVIALHRTQKKLAVSLALWVPSGSIKPMSLIWFIRQNLCLLSGLLFLVIAIAGPFLNHKASGLETRHGLVVIALKNDGKSSPASINLQARLLSQIQKEHFLREGGRIGLMPYGGESELFCPLTLDPEFYEYVVSSLKKVSVERTAPDILGRVGSLGEALKNALETLQNQNLNTKQIVVILFENQDGVGSVQEALNLFGIPDEIGLTLVFPEDSKVPVDLRVYCAEKNAETVALDSKIIPDGRVLEVLKKGDSSGVSFQDDGVVFVAAPAWFAFPGLLCLLIAFMFPPNVSALSFKLAKRGDQ
ncbi:MAG: hypothetical protein DWH95_06760 [Planctomycetota bacterium]|nr:MAG: hypothetical protein DWH95_06760 [Planctomycetota bacterium]